MKLLPLLLFVFLTSLPVSAFDINDVLADISRLPSVEQYENYQALANDKGLNALERFAVLKRFSIYLLGANQLDNALSTAVEALALTEKNSLKRQQAEAEKLIGIVHYYKGEHQKALEFYQLALLYFEQAEEPIEQANLLNNIALVQNALGRHRAALDSYLAAEPLYMTYGSEYDAVDLRANMAGLYIALRRFDQAIELLNGAIDYYQANEHFQDLARAKAELGVALKYSQQYPLALMALTDALNFYQQVDNKYQTAATLHNIAEVHLMMNVPHKGLAYASQGVLISRESGHQKALIGNLHALAKSHFWQEEYVKAQFAINEAISLAEQLEYNTSLPSLLMQAALVESALNQPKLALDYQHKYQSLESNRFNTELNQLLSEAETEQLKHKLELVEHKSQIQAQLSENEATKERYLFAGLILFFIVIFLLYKRLRDKQLNKELQMQLKVHTKLFDK